MNGVFQQPSSRKSCLQRWEEILWAQTEPMAQLQQSAHRITCPLNWFQPSYPSPPIPHMHDPPYHGWHLGPALGKEYRHTKGERPVTATASKIRIGLLQPSGPLLVPRLLLVFLASLIHAFPSNSSWVTCLRYQGQNILFPLNLLRPFPSHFLPS